MPNQPASAAFHGRRTTPPPPLTPAYDPEYLNLVNEAKTCQRTAQEASGRGLTELEAKYWMEANYWAQRASLKLLESIATRLEQMF